MTKLNFLLDNSNGLLVQEHIYQTVVIIVRNKLTNILEISFGVSIKTIILFEEMVLYRMAFNLHFVLIDGHSLFKS